MDASAVFGRKREFAPPYTMEDLDLFEAKIKGRSDNPVSSSAIMSYLRSEDDVKQRYLEMYQILPGDELDGGRLLSQKEREDNKEVNNQMPYKPSEELLKKASNKYNKDRPSSKNIQKNKKYKNDDKSSKHSKVKKSNRHQSTTHYSNINFRIN